MIRERAELLANALAHPKTSKLLDFFIRRVLPRYLDTAGRAKSSFAKLFRMISTMLQHLLAQLLDNISEERFAEIFSAITTLLEPCFHNVPIIRTDFLLLVTQIARRMSYQRISKSYNRHYTFILDKDEPSALICSRRIRCFLELVWHYCLRDLRDLAGLEMRLQLAFEARCALVRVIVSWVCISACNCEVGMH
jgi:hypothetical protein